MTYQGQPVEEVNTDLWQTNISKAIYGTTVSLNSKLIHAAIEAGVKLRVTCPGGEEVIDPKEWKETSNRRAKFFKYNTPIWLYERDIKKVSQTEKNIREKNLVLEEQGQRRLF